MTNEVDPLANATLAEMETFAAALLRRTEASLASCRGDLAF